MSLLGVDSAVSLFILSFEATFKAQVDAIHRLATESAECCRFHRTITGDSFTEEASQELTDLSETQDETHADGSAPVEEIQDGLNRSQRVAVRASRTSQVTLIWGPPGKMTVAYSPLYVFLLIFANIS